MSKAMTNMSLFAIALVINKSISLLMLPVLPHFLTPEQMGKLELLTTFGVVTTLLVSFALHEALYRFVGVEKDAQKRTVSLNQLYSLSVLIAGAVAAILLLLIALLPIPEPFTRIEFAVVTLAIVLEGSIAIGTAWLRLSLIHIRRRRRTTLCRSRRAPDHLKKKYPFTPSSSCPLYSSDSAYAPPCVVTYSSGNTS